MENIICGYLDEDMDVSCKDDIISFADQRAVLINMGDMDQTTVNIDAEEHTVSFSLKSGSKGNFIIGHHGGNSIGELSTANRTDTGRIVFTHQADIIFGGIASVTEKYKEKLAKGLFVVAMKVGEEIVILGIKNGLMLEDGTEFDRRENGGEFLASLASHEERQEPKTPLIYKAAIDGDELEDFFNDFESA